MASQPAPILWVSPSDPWSTWTLSGITLKVCRELRERGRLFGALSAVGARRRYMNRPPAQIGAQFDRIARRLNLLGSKWNNENGGVVGDVLRELPEDGVVVYQFVDPVIDPSLDIRRFRYMDLSITDAVRTETYGHQGLTDQQIEIKTAAQKRLLDGCEGVLTLSTHAADAIARDFDFPRERITPVGAGPAFEPTIEPIYDIERYAAARILFVGFNWERKGGPLLLEAFRIVRDVIPHATLHVVGPPQCPADEAGVRWTPPINKAARRGRRQLEEIFAEASVYCMPSICETWGLVYVEAQQMGTPIVGFREWAVPDIIKENETGLFSNERTAQSLAASLIEALSDAERLKAMGAAATQRMRDVFAWPRVVDRIVYGLAKENARGPEPVWMQPKNDKITATRDTG